MSLLTRLNFSFDVTKFGGAEDPDGTLQTKLDKSMKILTTTTTAAYNAVVASNTANSTYYQNPVASTCNNLKNIIISAYDLIYNAYTQTVDPDTGGYVNTYPFRDAGMTNNYNAVIREIATVDSNDKHTPLSFNSYISHTNRLSNLDYSNKDNRPDFNSGLRACKTVQTLVYQTEKNSVSATTIAGLGLGCFTSLFINLDLVVRYNNFNVLNGQAFTFFNGGLITSVTTPMSDCVNSFKSELEALLTLVQTQRGADEDFYQAANSVLTDVNKVNGLVNSVNGSMFSDPRQLYLINNFVGTSGFDQFKT